METKSSKSQEVLRGFNYFLRDSETTPETAGPERSFGAEIHLNDYDGQHILNTANLCPCDHCEKRCRVTRAILDGNPSDEAIRAMAFPGFETVRGVKVRKPWAKKNIIVTAAATNKKLFGLLLFDDYRLYTLTCLAALLVSAKEYRDKTFLPLAVVTRLEAHIVRLETLHGFKMQVPIVRSLPGGRFSTSYVHPATNQEYTHTPEHARNFMTIHFLTPAEVLEVEAKEARRDRENKGKQQPNASKKSTKASDDEEAKEAQDLCASFDALRRMNAG